MNAALNFLSGMSDGAVIIRIAIASLFGSLIGWERVARHSKKMFPTFLLK